MTKPPPPLIFSGSSHPILAHEIADLLQTSLGNMDLQLFPDHEIFVQIHEDVHAQSVFVIQSLFPDTNFHLMELLIIIDALKRAGAASITAVIPYYGYARQDRVDKPGTALSAKLVADLLTVAGIDSLITLDLHSDQIQGFFNIPMIHLSSRELLITHVKTMGLGNLIVVAPDKGGVKIASTYSNQLGCPLAIIDKKRLSPLIVETHLFIGDVEGKTVLIPDDMCSAGQTLVQAANCCHEAGASEIFASVGHGLFVADALEIIQSSPIKMVVTTNSVTTSSKVAKHPKIQTLSVAPLFAKAIHKHLIPGGP